MVYYNDNELIIRNMEEADAVFKPTTNRMGKQ